MRIVNPAKPRTARETAALSPDKQRGKKNKSILLCITPKDTPSPQLARGGGLHSRVLLKILKEAFRNYFYHSRGKPPSRPPARRPAQYPGLHIASLSISFALRHTYRKSNPSRPPANPPRDLQTFFTFPLCWPAEKREIHHFLYK